MIRRLGTSLLFASVLLAMACSSNPSKTLPQAVVKPKPLKSNQKPTEPPPPNRQQLLAFALKFSSPENHFHPEDRKFLDRIKHKPGDSIAEAALTVGLVRQIHAELTALPAQLNTSEQPEQEKPKHSLEAAADCVHVDLYQALRSNILLQKPFVFELVQNILRRSNDSELYRSQISNHIHEVARSWAALIPDETTEEDIAEELNPPEATDIEGPPSLSPSDLRSADDALKQAQLLADRGDFLAAVNSAAKIVSADPLYPAAQEKIRQFSNQAVRTLRQKAAQAFQESLPSDDPATKAGYLQRAQELLQQALDEFPSADNLARVRDNLAVISKDLQLLQGIATE